MKPTRIKVSVSQDGLLPQETADVATVEFPALPKKLLRALGFEKVDATTFVGVLPVFVNLGDEQEIEIELGVGVPEMRKKVLEILTSREGDEPAEQKTESDKPEKPDKKKKSTSSGKSAKSKTAKSSGKSESSAKKTKKSDKKTTSSAKSGKTRSSSKSGKTTKKSGTSKSAGSRSK